MSKKKDKTADENQNLGFSDTEILNEEITKNQIQNLRLGNADVRMLGDKTTLISMVKLLAYVRHAINSRTPTTLTLKIGTKIADGQFLFDVNGLEIPDYIT